jgi:hypothetical protein
MAAPGALREARRSAEAVRRCARGGFVGPDQQHDQRRQAKAMRDSQLKDHTGRQFRVPDGGHGTSGPSDLLETARGRVVRNPQIKDRRRFQPALAQQADRARSVFGTSCGNKYGS